MPDLCVDTPAEAFLIVVIAVVIASEVAVLASDVWADGMIDLLTGLVFRVVTANGTNGSADTDFSMWAPTTTALGCIPMLTPFEELSTCGWGACSC